MIEEQRKEKDKHENNTKDSFNHSLNSWLNNRINSKFEEIDKKLRIAFKSVKEDIRQLKETIFLLNEKINTTNATTEKKFKETEKLHKEAREREQFYSNLISELKRENDLLRKTIERETKKINARTEETLKLIKKKDSEVKNLRQENEQLKKNQEKLKALSIAKARSEREKKWFAKKLFLIEAIRNKERLKFERKFSSLKERIRELTKKQKIEETIETTETRKEKKEEKPLPREKIKEFAKWKKALNFLWLIPLLIFIYLGYTHFIASHEFNYFYDIGSEKDASKPYLSPSTRISEPFSCFNETCRNLTSQLVYFDVPIPFGADKVNVKVNFIDNFPNRSFLLGAKDQESWHYTYNILYSPVFHELSKYEYGGRDIKIYRINREKPLVSSINEIPINSVIAFDSEINLSSILLPLSYETKETTIKTGLRSNHVFYVYLKDSLDLKVVKQDINWYNNSDELIINLYDLNNNLIANVTIPDDGIVEAKPKIMSEPQQGFLKVDALPEGIYKLEFGTFDGIIKEIKINTNKIVTKQVFLADSNLYIPNSRKESKLYLNLNRDSTLNLITYHKEGLQEILISNLDKGITEPFKFNIEDSTVYLKLEKGRYILTFPENDIIVESPFFFSFSSDGLFQPFIYFINTLPQDVESLKTFDYVIIQKSNLSKENNFYTSETFFETKNLYIKDKKLNMVLNAPHLSVNETQNYTVPINWINVTVYKNGFLKKIKK